MTAAEALSKMENAANAAKERLSGYGFDISIHFDYMNFMLKTVETPEKASLFTVSVIIGGNGVPEGDEYCMSLGADKKRGKISDEIFERDLKIFGEMIEYARETLDSYEDKLEGLKKLTDEAAADHEKTVAKLEKAGRIASIANTAFLIGVAVLFIIALILGIGS